LLSDELDIETAFVDPYAAGGYITNYPNPFHPGEAPTTIAYKLDDNATVTLKIYTITGGLVFEKSFPAGQPGGRTGLNEFVWDGKNGKGTTVASGGYVVDIQAAGSGETLHTMRRKLAVVR
jgi:flagellar hook assembly protein FlgD